MLKHFIFALFTTLIFVGCPTPPEDEPETQPPEPSGPAVGEEGGPCNASDECFGELTCVSDLCVDLGSIDGDSDGSTEGSSPTDAGSNNGSSDGSSAEDAGSSDGSGDGTAPVDAGSSDVSGPVDAGVADGSGNDAGPEPECRSSCAYGELCDENGNCVTHSEDSFLCSRCDPDDWFSLQCNGQGWCLLDPQIPPDSCIEDSQCWQYSETASCVNGICRDYYCGSSSCENSQSCPRGYDCQELLYAGNVSCTSAGNECTGGRGCIVDNDFEPGFCSCISDSDCFDNMPCTNPGPQGRCILAKSCMLAENLTCDEVSPNVGEVAVLDAGNAVEPEELDAGQTADAGGLVEP